MNFKPEFLQELKLNLDKDRLSLIEKKREQFLAMPKLGEVTQKSIDEKIKIEFIHSTCKIEGNTYTLAETEALIKYGTTASGKPMQDAQELKNQEQAIKYIFAAKDKNLEINEKLIKEVNSLVGKDVVRNYGSYRNQPVVITGTDYQPPKTQLEISQAMANFVDYLKNDKFKKRNLISQSIIVNFAVSYIQPFFDGNKRTGRLLQNLVLIKNSYPFITFEMKDVSDYREAIIYGYKTLNLDKLGKLVLEQLDKILDLYLSLSKK